ncbi:VRR-NUC domain-containing protein [Acidisoma cellulosilytica]|uniref:phosphodiesterase I n=1 Tax=Acidisoma cellulosilyticum TaxID=2802395 RepID=A0A963Z0D5_9PROT|nr:VRR-NUC domain-containing protein [Acidisoma cellulosilyticum]MCB8880537.1 VRR-NUC domain-containing protein [Acidisoma cellulosilyticum]
MRGGAEPGQSGQFDQATSHPRDPAPRQAETGPYYLEHFTQVLCSVASRYGFLLSDAERQHIDCLHGLSQPSRMLYARLVNRRGPCFRVDKLSYPELPMLETALAELQNARLLRGCSPDKDLGDKRPLLRCFTLPELTTELRRQGVSPPNRRAALLDWLHASDGQTDLLRTLLGRYRVIRLGETDPWNFLRFLFFGELRDNLSDFVIRELGFLTPEDIAPDQLAPLFRSRAEARDAFHMAGLYAEFRTIRGVQSARDTLYWWQHQGVTRDALAAGQESFDRLIDRLGRRLEREGEPALALALYATSQHGMTRDRQARLLIKEGRRAEATQLAEAMAEAPRNSDEAYAARHLLRRLTQDRRTSDARSLQKLGRVVQLQTTFVSVESATLAHYRALGWDGVHAENWLWNATFGLLFWDIIYDPGLGTFHSPLQTAPSDLYDRDFFARRESLIEKRLIDLQQDREAQFVATSTFNLKRGLTNPFVPWQDDILTYVLILIDRLPRPGLVSVLRRMAQDVLHHGRGFPDLFLWTAEDYSFVEVKSKTDQLSAAQYEWLVFFKKSGICVHIDNVLQA